MSQGTTNCSGSNLVDCNYSSEDIHTCSDYIIELILFNTFFSTKIYQNLLVWGPVGCGCYFPTPRIYYSYHSCCNVWSLSLKRACSSGSMNQLYLRCETTTRIGLVSSQMKGKEFWMKGPILNVSASFSGMVTRIVGGMVVIAWDWTNHLQCINPFFDFFAYFCSYLCT